MTPDVLALWTAPRCDVVAGVEFLRAVTAFVALGRGVRLVALGAGCGVLDGDDLPEEAERHLEALAETGVRPEDAGASLPADLLVGVDTVLRHAAADRSGRPPLLSFGVASPPDQDTLLEAGQVIFERE